MKPFARTDRISAQLRRELGTLVRAAVDEHRLPSVSVSDVEVTRDLAHAKVFVTALQADRSKEALSGLKALAGEIRYRLARQVKLRDRKSTRLNSSHVASSYAGFCWKNRSYLRRT